MKQQLIAEIVNGFSAINISPQNDVSSDIVISEEFLDAGPGTGKNIINYEAFIFADESSSTIYMYELTKESSTGFVFGGEAESTVQSGTTLFRKIKSIKPGPDGRPYEITLDLGAIPKIVKEVARTNGWKFKTVLSKSKALYPTGYTSSRFSGDAPEYTSVDVTNNASVDVTDNASVDAHQSSKDSIASSSSTISEDNTVIPAHEKAVKSSLSGRSTAASKSRRRKRFFIGLLLALIILFALIWGSIKENGSFFFPTVHVSNACMAKSLNSETYEPLDNTSQFDSNSNIIYSASYIKNVTNGTKVSAIWHLPSNENLPSETAFTLIGDGWVPFFLTSDNGFPVGAYKVEILINNKVSKTLEFTVK